VADGHLSDERVESTGFEYLADQSLGFVDPDRSTVGYGNPCGFLSTVLEGIEREEGEFGRVTFSRRDGDDAALLSGSVAVEIQVAAHLCAVAISMSMSGW
jgi:hypothetical protein